MGISGLMTHCNDRRKDISERIDLMQVVRKRANQPGGPLIILVDYYAFESFILPKFLESEREKGGQDFNQHLRLCGGEYEDYDCYVRNFLETLRALGIVFEFYIDAPRGAAVGEADSKMATWRERFQDTVSFFAEIRRVCDGQLDIHRLRDKLVRPALLTLQTLTSIKHAGKLMINGNFGALNFSPFLSLCPSIIFLSTVFSLLSLCVSCFFTSRLFSTLSLLASRALSSSSCCLSFSGPCPPTVSFCHPLYQAAM